MVGRIQIQLPNNWRPRPDQMAMWAYLEGGGTRCDVVAHRRWGKDDVSLHWTAVAMHQRVGVYWHMLPEAAQARKAIWEAVNPRTGKRRIDEAFPKELRASTRDQDMFIRFKNGSTWQVLGSDNYDSFVGSPPIGVIFSEWALASPSGWNYVRPILLENGGWAVFIWTPRGRNHATRAIEARERDPDWFTDRKPAAQWITGEGGVKCLEALTPVFTPAQLEKELQELIDETGSVQEGTALFNSEYLVDFDAAVPGSYLGTQMQEAETSGRITKVEFNPAFKVDTCWDLGIDDYTAIWWMQRVAPDRVNVLNFYETGDLGFADDGAQKGIISEAFRDDRTKAKYSYGMHYLPHDVAVRELGAGGRTRRKTLHTLGISPIRTGIARNAEEGVNAIRRLLPYCYFNKETTQTGIDHLKQYSKRWNKAMGVFTGERHDEHSHAAHAMREFAVNAKLPEKRVTGISLNPPRSDPYRGKSMFADEKVLNWKTM
jgi:phage terminase large subunit